LAADAHLALDQNIAESWAAPLARRCLVNPGYQHFVTAAALLPRWFVCSACAWFSVLRNHHGDDRTSGPWH
jgi:hypothetical protein